MSFFGLTEKEVLELRKKYGQNLITGKEKISHFFIFFSQFKNPLVYILLFVGLISLFFKEFFDFVLVITVVILNTLMGYFQEYNAKKTLLSLRKILKPQTLVIREGKRKIIDARDLVPSDIVVLISGDKVPADGRLIEGEVLVEEAILTGEEEAILKTPKTDNELFMGTTVLGGKGIMKVTKIGKDTEIGKIGKSLVEIKEEKTPLQEKLEDLSKKLALVILFLCFFIFLFGILQKREFFETFRIALVLAVSAIPEALPVAITVILALGMRRILKKGGLVKTLLAVETLGSTSLICIDKTGTLTEGKMEVKDGWFLDKEKSLLNMVLNNEQRSSFEIAIFEFGNHNLTDDLKKKIGSAKEVYEEPFDSEKKYAMSLQRIGKKEIAFLMGAPEVLLEFCKNDQNEKKEILKIIERWAEQGKRMVGFAFKEGGSPKEKKDFIFSGLLAIFDPLRKNVKDLIEFAKKAGIEVKIVTGDHKITAQRVAKEIGFKINSENIIEGKELEEISDEQLNEKIEKVSVFARVFPHQKKRLVDVFQKKGEIVAMTGDGVNDALALKKADIGIAVGEAAEVAKEASDLILLDSNFKTIISACEQGRLVLSNIKKTVGYVLSNSFLEITLIFFSGLFGYPPPLTVAQILYLHLICDGPPDLMFAFEPKEKDLMKKKPINIKKEPILDRFLLSLILIISLTVTFFGILIYWIFGVKKQNLELGRTLVFAMLGCIDLIYAFSYKNLKKPIIKMENFFQNKFLFLGILYGFLLLFLAIYFPPLNRILETKPLELFWWLLIFGIGIFVTLILELAKGLNKFLNEK